MSLRGMVLGKFLPPHRGHVHLVDFARHYCDQLVVVVEKVPGEPIPSSLRVQWMRTLFPDCQIVHLADENPQDPADHPEFWTIWRESLLRCLPWSPDVVLASEDYGPRLAAELGARFVPVDPERASIAVSGTDIRRDPMRYFDHLPEVVRPYYVKRVRILGPESSGKSTLARALARRFHTVHVPEYAEKLIRLQDGRFGEADLPAFVRGQRADEQALARAANRVLVCDTDALTTMVWSRLLYDRVDPLIKAAASVACYHLTLVCMPDVPYAPDVHRVDPELRQDFLDILLEELRARDVEPVLLSGDLETRERAAAAAIEALIAPGSGPGAPWPDASGQR
jgi:HTH-type transcriptional repressor of NAD biosynthesis genes